MAVNTEEEAQEKVERLIKWFDTAKLPPVPYQQNAWTIILDLEKCLEVTAATLRNNKRKSEVFQAAYFRLYYLKQDIKKLNNE